MLKSVNVLKYTDYGHPIIYQKSDYRTSNARAHRFTLSAEKNFVPSKSHNLCAELKSVWTDYRPRSESAKEFSWKINSQRSHREELAPVSTTVRYTNQFTDKVKVSAAVVSLNKYKTQYSDAPPFTAISHKPNLTIVDPPKIEYAFRETHFTNTEGYFPHADTLVSTTELDYRPHSNYATARTNLIVRKEPPINSEVAFFIPKTKIIKENPLRNKYANKHLRDVAKFVAPSFDRIVPRKSSFVKNFGLTSEMSSNY